MPATTEKQSSTEKAAEAALTRAALTLEIARRWAADAGEADFRRLKADLTTNTVHALEPIADAAWVRSQEQMYDDPVVEAESLKYPIAALIVLLERLHAEDPEFAGLADVLGQLREAWRELYAVTAHESGVPVPRDTRPTAGAVAWPGECPHCGHSERMVLRLLLAAASSPAGCRSVSGADCGARTGEAPGARPDRPRPPRVRDGAARPGRDRGVRLPARRRRADRPPRRPPGRRR